MITILCHLSSVLCSSGSATASDVALKGGMSLIDGTFITAIFMGLSSVITAIGFIIHGKIKGGKAQRPVDSDDTFVTHGECKSHRCALEKRIDEIGPALNRIFNKISENDRKSEERANQMHRRIDPLIEKLAATAAEVDMLKKKT